MSLLSSKHKLDGIGEASASAVLASLAVNPSTLFLTVGVSGKITFFILSKIFSGFASMGLVVLNVGGERLITAFDKVGFDGSLETADKLIEEIRNTGRDMTSEEIKNIDDGVIKQFRKFAKIGRK